MGAAWQLNTIQCCNTTLRFAESTVPAILETDLQGRFLTDEDRTYADRFRSPQRQQQSLAGRILIRLLLENSWDHDPATWIIHPAPDGRPECRLGNLQCPISISHDGDHVMAALCPDFGVGIDVQRANPDRDIRRLIQGWLPMDDPAPVFPAQRYWQLWCLAEAWLKATGTNIDGDALARFLTSDKHSPAGLQGTPLKIAGRAVWTESSGGLEKCLVLDCSAT